MARLSEAEPARRGPGWYLWKTMSVHPVPNDPARGSPERGKADAELLAHLRREPNTAAPLVYARFKADVNRLVWRLLGADPDHHDLVQLVFIKVFRNCQRLREPEKFGAWVQSIAVNSVYEELRKREVRRLFLRDGQASEIYPNLVHDVEVRDQLRRSKAILEKLPAKERIVFLLHFLEGRSLVEIAETCGYSLATAKRRLAAANRRFESLVGRDPEFMRMLRSGRSDGAGEEESE
jgi:RNA polymerase sigma-70 factor, ECF subfamily